MQIFLGSNLSFHAILELSKVFFFFQAEDGIRDAQESRGLGDVYKRQLVENKFASLHITMDDILFLISLVIITGTNTATIMLSHFNLIFFYIYSNAIKMIINTKISKIQYIYITRTLLNYVRLEIR